jgi:RsiW-degrading membrane proteinase PrsW (M82 family)
MKIKNEEELMTLLGQSESIKDDGFTKQLMSQVSKEPVEILSSKLSELKKRIFYIVLAILVPTFLLITALLSDSLFWGSVTVSFNQVFDGLWETGNMSIALILGMFAAGFSWIMVEK